VAVIDVGLRAPFPFIGGKSRAASLVWEALGDVDSYVEPFCGSAAVLLNRPADHQNTREIINDADGLIINVWRALAFEPAETARWADWPATESDLHARHVWLVGQRESLTAKLEGDPGWCDPQAAGWWLWGAACWIGGGWCAGVGPWRVVDGDLVNTSNDGQGVNRQRLQLGDDGRGVNRKLLHLGDGRGVSLWSEAVPWGDGAHLLAWFRALAVRLERVWIVLCGVDEEHDDLLNLGWRKPYWSGKGGYGRATKPEGVLSRRHLEALWMSPHSLTAGQARFEL
jgi:DNA adenine methylase